MVSTRAGRSGQYQSRKKWSVPEQEEVVSTRAGGGGQYQSRWLVPEQEVVSIRAGGGDQHQSRRRWSAIERRYPAIERRFPRRWLASEQEEVVSTRARGDARAPEQEEGLKEVEQEEIEQEEVRSRRWSCK